MTTETKLEPPRRRHVVGIRVEGDTWKDVVNEMFHLARIFEERGPGRELTGGGPDRGSIAIDFENPEQTHDNWYMELEAWIAQRKKEKNNGSKNER